MSPCCQFSPTLKQFREDLLNGNDQLRICLPICPEEWYVLCTQATLNFGCKRKCPFKACDCDSKTFQTLCFEHPNGIQPQEKKKKKSLARIFHLLPENSNRLTVVWNLLFHEIKNLYFGQTFLDKKDKPELFPEGVSKHTLSWCPLAPLAPTLKTCPCSL